MSWVHVDADSHFPIQNLPFGIFSRKSDPHSPRRAGVAIGEHVLDLAFLHREGFFENIGFDSNVFTEPTLNSFMALERKHWRAARSRVHDILAVDGQDARLRSSIDLQKQALVPKSDVTMHLPAEIGDYTDFYSSREHATNVGIMFRGVDNALQPNWLHLPVGYHGRASSVVLSGTDIVRPSGQVAIDKDDHKKGSTYSPCRLMDFELEMAIFVGGKPNPMGRPLTIEEAEEHIFGVVIMNDWSARDIQAWEYVPLGPFTAKNFATSISPWIVSMDALSPFKTSTSAGPVQHNPDPLPYLQDPNYATSSYDIKLEVKLRGPNDAAESTISRSNLKYMYWNFKQQLVHHTVTGCNMRAGDLLGTGTISGPTPDSLGSMLELSWRGSRDVVLENSIEQPAVRKFLKDGDTVTMTGFAQGEGFRIGFGDVRGKLLPAGSAVQAKEEVDATVASATNLKLYSYWRSTSSWRVRLALALKGLDYEYKTVDLLPLVGNTTTRLSEEYRSINPLEQVPLLEVTEADGSSLQLTQSIAIIEYLEESFPGRPSVLPKKAAQRARARQIAEIINSGIQPLQNLSVLRQVKAVELISEDPSSAQGDGRAFAIAAINKGLAAVESILSHTAPIGSGLFAAGTDSPSLADICLVPQAYNARRFNIDMSIYPHISAVVAQCESLPSFQKAAPESQPDAKL